MNDALIKHYEAMHNSIANMAGEKADKGDKTGAALDISIGMMFFAFTHTLTLGQIQDQLTAQAGALNRLANFAERLTLIEEVKFHQAHGMSAEQRQAEILATEAERNTWKAELARMAKGQEVEPNPALDEHLHGADASAEVQPKARPASKKKGRK